MTAVASLDSVANQTWRISLASCSRVPPSAAMDATWAGMPIAGIPEPRRPSEAGLQWQEQGAERGRPGPTPCRQ